MNFSLFRKSCAFLCLAFFSQFCFAESFSFKIDSGTVTSVPSFCHPKFCETQSGPFVGTFDAKISGQKIALSNIQIKSKVVGFTLPENPNSSARGSVLKAHFVFDGETLVMNGSIDSRAFDGPYVKYRFTASVVAAPVDPGFDAKGYYHARPDYRKCASPMCGGIYVSKLNKRFMRCPDGSRAKECYVGTVDWGDVGVPFSANQTALIKGTISRDSAFDLIAKWGVFEAEAAFRPVSTQRPRGMYVGLENNGIVCITSPCFSFDQYILNKKRVKKISNIDLSRVKASKKDIEAAYRILGAEKTLLAVGYNKREKGFAGYGRKFIATQFYLPVASRIVRPLCPVGYALTDFGCATRRGCFFPQLELKSIGGAAMVDPKTGELTASITYSCVDKCERPAEQTSNGYCELALP